MSFNQLKKDLLRQVAEDFAVDVEDDATKDQIIAALAADGVTWDMYKKAFPDEEDQDDAKPKTTDDVDDEDDEDDDEADSKEDARKQYKKKSSLVLLKMTRSNGTYEVRGHRFTRDHPYLPVSEDDANFILDNIEGFKIATPREAEEYYS